MRIAIPALLGAALFSFSLGAAPTEPPPASPAAAGAEPDPPPAEPHGSADLLWAALQLVPSPETVIWNNQVRFGARWQVTPLLYSFGRSRRVSPWRSFLVEPIARHSGSIEAYFSPEILAGSIPEAIDRWIASPEGLQALIDCDLYAEAPKATPRWAHLQTRATVSGKRVFNP